MEMKTCNICNIPYPKTEEYFYKNNRWNALYPYCKKCSSKKSNKWSKNNASRRHELSKEPLKITEKLKERFWSKVDIKGKSENILDCVRKGRWKNGQRQE